MRSERDYEATWHVDTRNSTDSEGHRQSNDKRVPRTHNRMAGAAAQTDKLTSLSSVYESRLARSCVALAAETSSDSSPALSLA